MWRLEKLERAINQALADNVFPLVLGGDSSQTVGCFSALKNYAENGRLILLDQCHRQIVLNDVAFEANGELLRNKSFEPEKDLILLGAN